MKVIENLDREEKIVIYLLFIVIGAFVFITFGFLDAAVTFDYIGEDVRIYPGLPQSARHDVFITVVAKPCRFGINHNRTPRRRNRNTKHIRNAREKTKDKT